jgi:hypothetical protein
MKTLLRSSFVALAFVSASLFAQGAVLAPASSTPAHAAHAKGKHGKLAKKAHKKHKKRARKGKA